MGQTIEIKVPDIGDFDEVEVVEILVAQGDTVEIDDPIVSIESDKATMEIPASSAGIVAELRVKEGDRVSEGSVLVLLDADASANSRESSGETSEGTPEESASENEAAKEDRVEQAAARSSEAEEKTETRERPGATGEDEREEAVSEESSPVAARTLSRAAAFPIPDRAGLPHASPLVRRYARELGVPLEKAPGSGPHGRILTDDLTKVVRERFAADAGADSAGSSTTSASASAIPPVPAVDFSAFGPVHEQKLTRIQKASGPNLHRSWLNVPHVTQHEDADVTALERFRQERKAEAATRGLKLSPLLFVMKAVVTTLREFPAFRSSLAPEGDRLIVKDFYHLGIAVDTDQGLVVPVIRDVDRKGIFELAAEVNETAERARNRKLGPDDLRGAVFTISSLGGIGGTAFTPIVNAPEVAILGLSKTRVRPVWQGRLPPASNPAEESDRGPRDATPVSPVAEEGSFVPRQLMPLSLSYDHRVIDGAQAARFTARLAEILSDPLFLLL